MPTTVDKDAAWWLNFGDYPLHEIGRPDNPVLVPGVHTQIHLSDHLKRQPHVRQENPPGFEDTAEVLAAGEATAQAAKEPEALAPKEAETSRKQAKPK